MENFNRIWRAFFVIGLIGIAVQQFIFADFRPVILPQAYPAWLAHRQVWAWIFGLILIAASMAILFEIKARAVSLVMAAVLLLVVLLFQISGQPYPNHLGVWTNPFKELTLSGGAFVVAGTFQPLRNASGFITFLGKLIPIGKYFFAITLALFGSMHFVYPDFCASLVPNWIPWHYFWMYFGAMALIAGGLGIIIKPTRSLAAFWTGVMLFLWVIILHIPRAVPALPADNGNEWTSVFEALAFSGIAFMIAGKRQMNKIQSG
jgi:uncharacterized membrane protein